ncbi:mismatch-specific DNA-glycosylase [Deinococcus peraridilitoris]|uniref:G:T/U mismatch-specific DNA glycosylase n=1 Tax=Deinococcus peraridilitoris (strain DSM 19664 / LMG 22246 / CIP 109416 / KR-200) TaxID=937777 RepID=L0A540_DEIPD|nr:mismatch-specific DNA-glycosylase [Deinococcus peraridilitoris]AFZ68297.1 G:T/U mismatch-specific DNA glycosylase [Deinococcus peraridilitoris DSM 19664]
MTAPATSDYIVPDLLREGLVLVFCGTAPSPASARARAYYAHPHNKFWPLLHRAGFTPRQLRPTEYPELLSWDIGLTDMAKRHFGIDSKLPKEAWAPLELREKLVRYAPRLLAFTSKRAASEALSTPTGKLPYGRQERTLEGTELWVLPSTSPLGDNHFREEPWLMLGERYRDLRLAKDTIGD